MKSRILAAAAVALSLTGAGCASNYGTKQTVGGLGGAALGGLLGAQVGGDGAGQLAATAAGAVIGGFLGSELGASLDRADRQYASRAATTAFQTYPTGQTSAWQNPQTGNSGTITPVSNPYYANGRTCRNYQQTIYVGGQAQTANGTACQNANGSWSIVS